MTSTRADLETSLFNDLGFNKKEASEFVELFFEKISSTLESGRGVKLTGFGSFILTDKPSRPGRNPKTGEDAEISARRVVTLRPSQKLKTSVRKNTFELTQKLGRKKRITR